MSNQIKKAGNIIHSYLTHYNGEGMSAVHPHLNLNEWKANVQLALKKDDSEKQRDLEKLLREAINYLKNAHSHFMNHKSAWEHYAGREMSATIQNPDKSIVGLKAIFDSF